MSLSTATVVVVRCDACEPERFKQELRDQTARAGIALETTTNNTGDIAFIIKDDDGGERLAAVIERKARGDFGSSITSRFSEQRRRLALLARPERAEGTDAAAALPAPVTAIVLLEGDVYGCTNVASACLDGAQLALIGDGVHILLSRDEQHTARIVVRYAQSIAAEGGTARSAPLPERFGQRAKARGGSPQEVFVAQLRAIETVGATKAVAVAEHFSHSHAAMLRCIEADRDAAAAEIAAVRCGKQSVGKVTAARIVDAYVFAPPPSSSSSAASTAASSYSKKRKRDGDKRRQRKRAHSEEDADE